MLYAATRNALQKDDFVHFQHIKKTLNAPSMPSIDEIDDEENITMSGENTLMKIHPINANGLRRFMDKKYQKAMGNKKELLFGSGRDIEERRYAQLQAEALAQAQALQRRNSLKESANEIDTTSITTANAEKTIKDEALAVNLVEELKVKSIVSPKLSPTSPRDSPKSPSKLKSPSFSPRTSPTSSLNTDKV